VRKTLAADADSWVYHMTGCGEAFPDVFVAINRADSPRTVNLFPGSYTDLLAGASVQGGAVELPARGVGVWRREPAN